LSCSIFQSRRVLILEDTLPVRVHMSSGNLATWRDLHMVALQTCIFPANALHDPVNVLRNIVLSRETPYRMLCFRNKPIRRAEPREERPLIQRRPRGRPRSRGSTDCLFGFLPDHLVNSRNVLWMPRWKTCEANILLKQALSNG